MELKLKPDFDEVLQRFEAWWRCQIIDRPLVTPNVKPPGSPRPPRKHHASLRDRWMDAEHSLDCFEAGLETAVFMGEAFPRYEPGLGPELCATVFGCELTFAERTSYSVPAARSCREILDIRPNLDNPYWNNIRAKTDLSLARGRGQWLTGMPDLHTNGDLLASLRDPQDLCLDLGDNIDAVRAACDYVTEAGYGLMFDDLWSRIAAAGEPCTNWTPALHCGRMYTTSCDFICMISPGMFRKAILPGLVREMRYLERNIFHLDGPGAVKHLDALLELPELDGVQWVYGAGQGPARRWIEVYRKVQAAGKCLQVHCEDFDDARAVAEHIRPEGVWFTPYRQYEPDEAEAFLQWVQRWAAGKRA